MVELRQRTCTNGLRISIRPNYIIVLRLRIKLFEIDDRSSKPSDSQCIIDRTYNLTM